jgi:hypothetical protein|tara:strand:+ start:811 stop:2748 length:1938 start_codon:yes stop_codon:yes gene_type:complete
MIGEVTKNSNISSYQPSREVIDLTKVVKADYYEGHRILHEPWVELNDRSVITDENRGQSMFNAFVDTSYEDTNEDWKWRGTRSKARNKAIAMHAQLTSNFLLPLFMAQNDEDEVDKGFSEVMRDVIEWMAQPTNSNYQASFLQAVFGMMTSPVIYLGAEYCEVMQKIKTKLDSGEIEVQEVADEVLSGFRADIWACNEVLITNAYERNIQKQKSVIKRRYIEKEELEAKYGEHENWPYVQTGIKSIYSEANDLFYDIYDDDHRDLVAEEIHQNRREDSEVAFINGIYMGDSNVENNPIKHRDNRNAPKYNIVPFGYHRIGPHFFYYKSMMNAMGWDNDLYDAMTEIVMNRALLEVEMPIAISGTDKVDSEVIFPNAVVALENKDAKVSPLLPPSNTNLGLKAIEETEESMDEGSISPTMEGQLPDAAQKAYSVAQAQANAKKMIGAVAKSLAQSVIQFGDLMKDIAINNITAPQIDELVGSGMKLKYRKFYLENKETGGKQRDMNIIFDESLIGKQMSEPEVKMANLKLLEESGYPDKKISIRKVNPELFAKFKYLTKVDIEEMHSKSPEYWQPILLHLRRELANDPYIDMESIDRRVAHAFFQSDGESIIKSPEKMQPQQPEMTAKELPAPANVSPNKRLAVQP